MLPVAARQVIATRANSNLRSFFSETSASLALRTSSCSPLVKSSTLPPDTGDQVLEQRGLHLCKLYLLLMLNPTFLLFPLDHLGKVLHSSLLSQVTTVRLSLLLSRYPQLAFLTYLSFKLSL